MRSDFTILLAWPETKCKQAGSWYDGLMCILGFSKDKYYKVGHAAIVLVNSKTGKCHYFDFGRYHAPFGYGRIRDEETDHDLVIQTKAEIESNQIINIDAILNELADNKSCHGEGYLYASVVKSNFSNAFKKAKVMQQEGTWPYGPFIWKGTNCSRFVRTVALAGKSKLINQIRLRFPLTLSPTPKGNVNSTRTKYRIETSDNNVCLSEKNIQTTIA